MRVGCTICEHEQRKEIDRALLERKPLRPTAKLYGTSTASLQRHREHLAAAVVKAQAAREVVREVAGPESLLSDVHAAEGRAGRLYGAAESILGRALEAEDLRTALNAIKAAVEVMGEARQYMELRGELTGELQSDRGQAPHAVQLMQILMLPPKREVTQIVDAKPAGGRNS